VHRFFALDRLQCQRTSPDNAAFAGRIAPDGSGQNGGPKEIGRTRRPKFERRVFSCGNQK
jgi:hypothetical protein